MTKWKPLSVRLKHILETPSESGDREDLILALSGIFLELAFLLFWKFSGIWRGAWQLTVGFFLPGTIYLIILCFIFKGSQPAAGKRSRILIIGFSFLFLITFFFTPEPLSNDLYRYYWDGKILANRINPYAYPPDALELVQYRDPFWNLVFNRDIPTGYPPLAAIIFGISYWILPHPWFLRFVAIMAVMGTSLFLMKALRLTAKDERRVIMFAWSPLVILEFANSAHLDIYALFFMCAALVFALEEKDIYSSVCLALGGLVKFFPILLLPLWGRRWSKRAWYLFFIIIFAVWTPFLSGGSPFRGLAFFATHAELNSSLFRFVDWVMSSLTQSETAHLLSRLFVGATIAGIYLWFVLFANRDKDVLSGWRFSGLIFGLLLLFSPVVHPWYFCWMLTFITIEGSAIWLAPSITIIFARWAYVDYEQMGVWKEPDWLPLAVWAPFYFLLGVKIWKTTKKQSENLIS